jgi:hypothetical protein
MNHVYLIRAANSLYKIGFASNIERRFNTLRAQSPIPLELVLHFNGENARELERELHDKFSDKRHHGEWFELSDEDLDYIQAQDVTYKMMQGEKGIKKFEDRMGRVGYSARCPNCKNRSRTQHGNDILTLECKHCGTITKFSIPKEEQDKCGAGCPCKAKN